MPGAMIRAKGVCHACATKQGRQRRSISDQIVKSARHQRAINPAANGEPTQRDHPKGKPGEGADRGLREFFVDEVAQKKAPPENFLDQGDDNHEAQKAENDGAPIQSRLAGEDFGIEAGEPRRKAEELLRRDPQNENRQADGHRKPGFPRSLKIVIPPKPNQKRAADEPWPEIQYSAPPAKSRRLSNCAGQH